MSYPDPDYKSPQQAHLWVLVGGTDNFDGSTAFYLGASRDISGDDLAGGQLDELIERAAAEGLDVDREVLVEVLADFRRAMG